MGTSETVVQPYGRFGEASGSSLNHSHQSEEPCLPHWVCLSSPAVLSPGSTQPLGGPDVGPMQWWISEHLCWTCVCHALCGQRPKRCIFMDNTEITSEWEGGEDSA